MAVRLDRLPAQATRPPRPRFWVWLALLPFLSLLSVGAALLFDGLPLDEQSAFWRFALGAPLTVWCVLGFVRLALYIFQHSVADGWDEARKEDLIRRLRRGRRSQQVLSVSLYTALREPDAPAAAQLEALLAGTVALKAQASRLGGATARHSRLPGNPTEEPDRVLLRVLRQVLADLAPTVAQLPVDKPLALLLEVDSQLSKSQVNRIWHQAWSGAGILQRTVAVEGRGLSAIDLWLDKRIKDQALLMVVAVQLAPSQPQGTTEVGVGLLFGNRLTQTDLPPMAYLHRPEKEHEPCVEKLRYAVCQALDWVPLEAKAITHVWRTGINAERNVAMCMALNKESLPTQPKYGLYDLDASLGHAGRVSPWLAIAAAAEALQRNAEPHFILSGGDPAEAGLWGMVMMPAG